MEFENAQMVKERLEILEDYQTHSMVVNAYIDDVDVFGIFSDESAAYVNYFKINNGSIVQSFTTEIKKYWRKVMKRLWKKLWLKSVKNSVPIPKRFTYPYIFQSKSLGQNYCTEGWG